VHTHLQRGLDVKNESGLGKWAQKSLTNTELPMCCPHRPADGPAHQMRPKRDIWSWQMWKGGHAHACSAGLGCKKRDWSRKMGPETQTNTELSIRCPQGHSDSPEYQVQPRRNIWSWQMWKGGHAHACAVGLGCEKRDRKIGPETQTNTELPIRCTHRPADAPAHQVRLKRNIWSWQI